MATALVLGGTGQVGLAVAARLLPDGWEVRLASRGRTEPAATVPEGARTVVLDRDDDAAVGSAADEVDLLVDAVCMTTAHARQLVALGDRVGALHVVSTLAVYADAAGRSLDPLPRPGSPSSRYRSGRTSRRWAPVIWVTPTGRSLSSRRCSHARVSR